MFPIFSHAIRLMCLLAGITLRLYAQQIPQAISFPIKPDEEALVGVSVNGGGALFKTNSIANGIPAETIRSFSPQGSKPTETLIDGGDGFLYGATAHGGTKAAGLIFRITPGGDVFEIIHDFQQSDGVNPSNGLLKGADGKLYGATELGGQFRSGVVFRLDRDGSNFQVLHEFSQFEGSYINGDLIQDASGTLFGMSTFGGGTNSGSIFRLQPDGSGFQVIHSFTGSTGTSPQSGLMEGLDGKLYGMTLSGGSNTVGTVFRVNKDGSGFSVIRNFDMSTGRNPMGKLTQDSAGTLYGFTTMGGTTEHGTIFRINPDGTGYQILHNFLMPYGSNPRGTPVLVGDALYGATMGGLDPHSVIFKIKTNGTDFEILHGVTAGWEKPTPQGTLLITADGNMYGTVSGLDISVNGAIFEFKPGTGEYTEIHSFEGNDGDFPHELLLTSNRRLYGVATNGGMHDGGILYSVDLDGSAYVAHHHFGGTDGILPLNALVQGPEGTLYGSTSGGGLNVNAGTLFAIEPSGANFRVLHDFENIDGRDVRGRLVLDGDGFLFGVTMEGGPEGGGVVFRIHQTGTGFEVLHHFIGTGDIAGSNPVGGLTLGSDGILYGTTHNGGESGYGTVFKINRDGSSFQKLHDFNTVTGLNPSSLLVESSNGDLIGLTSQGTTFYNTLFSIGKDGTNFTVRKVFDFSSGNLLFSGLTPGPANYLYGTMSTATGWAVYRIKEDGSGFLRIHDLIEPLSSFSDLTWVKALPPESGIQFNDFTGKVFGDAPFPLHASSTSGLPITFVSSNPAVATISGDMVTITGAGTAVITAYQSGNDQFAAAVPISQSLSVAKADQVVTFPAVQARIFGDPSFSLLASTTSVLPIVYTSSDPGVATISGSTVTITGAGTTTITASQPGNDNFNAAQPVSQSLLVSKADQLLTFPVIETKVFGAAPFALLASASSGLTVTFQSLSGSVSVTGGTATLLQPGKGKIKAIQAGSSNYHPTESEQEFCINPAKPTLTQNGNILSSSAPLGNRWFLDGDPIDITTQSFNPDIPGTYHVNVDIEGCVSEASDGFVLTITGDIFQTAANRVRIAPNPASDRLLIQLDNPGPANPVWITIRNTASVILSAFLTTESEVTLDVSKYPEGLYLIHTSLQQGRVTKFLVIK